MEAALDGGVLGGESEGVEAHGVHDVVAAHPHKAGVCVGRRHRVPMADMQVAGGVRVHGQRVPFGPRVVFGRAVELVGAPALLPLAVDLLMVVSHRRYAG